MESGDKDRLRQTTKAGDQAAVLLALLSLLQIFLAAIVRSYDWYRSKKGGHYLGECVQQPRICLRRCKALIIQARIHASLFPFRLLIFLSGKEGVS